MRQGTLSTAAAAACDSAHVCTPLATSKQQALYIICCCDAVQVPSYDSKIAFATIERELGKSISEVYSEISPEPLAAASLGQV